MPIPVENVDGIDEPSCKRYKVRTWAVSNIRVNKRYRLRIADGRTERVCSTYDSHIIAIAAMNDKAAAGIEALVLMADVLVHNSSRASWEAA